MMEPRKNHQHQRRPNAGFTLLEMLVATGFMTIAITTMLKMHSSLQSYDALSNQRFVNAVVLDNLVNQLKMLDHPDRLAMAEEIASQSGARVLARPFVFQTRNGVQLTLSKGTGANLKTRHFWSFDPTQ